MAFTLPDDLAPELYPLAWLTGTWRGYGILTYGETVPEQAVYQEMTFDHDGGPYLRQTTKKIHWPLAIGTLNDTNILVRFSTMPYSPLAVQATTVGHRLGLLESAMGNAYLAWCDEEQRGILVQTLLSEALNPKAIQKLVLQKIDITRRQGYGLRLPPRNGESATIAVPIGQGKDILGVLGLTTFGRLMTASQLHGHQQILSECAQAMLEKMSSS